MTHSIFLLFVNVHDFFTCYVSWFKGFTVVANQAVLKVLVNVILVVVNGDNATSI